MSYEMVGQTVLLVNDISRIIITGKADVMQMFYQQKNGIYKLIGKTAVVMDVANEACALRWFNAEASEIFRQNVRDKTIPR